MRKPKLAHILVWFFFCLGLRIMQSVKFEGVEINVCLFIFKELLSNNVHEHQKDKKIWHIMIMTTLHCTSPTSSAF